jgi:DUF1009 family protein
VSARQRIGLIAGWGDLPGAIARNLIDQGAEVYALGIHGHADTRLRDICHAFRMVGLARSRAQIRFFQRHGVRQATMAGKLFKTRMFRRWAWVRHCPDTLFVRHFFPHFVSGTANRNDDALLLAVTDLFESKGIHMVPATDFAPELFVKPGVIGGKALTHWERHDVEYGWHLARQMGGLDVGQCVAVKRRAVLAVEAIEGTDLCIRRAGELCPTGGFTVVKVAKPNQDMRFDVPTIGIGTLETMRVAGGRVLAIEAGRTIVLDQPKLAAYARSHGITIVALRDSDVCAGQKAA